VDESHERDERLSPRQPAEPNQQPESRQPGEPRQQAEGVRIIRAEEAQAALDTGLAAGRRPEDEPRFGDVPPPPEGPRSPHRFPLPDSVDPASAVPRPAIRAPERRFGGRLTNRGKTAETVRAPSPPRVVRLLGPDAEDAGTGAQPLPADTGWGDDADWSTEVTRRREGTEPLSVGATTDGPKHFAKDSSAPSGSGWGSSGAGAAADAAASIGGSGGGADHFAPASGSSALGGSAGSGSGADNFSASYDPPLPPPPLPMSPGERGGPPPLPDLAPPEEGINVHTGAIPALQHWTDPPTGEVPFIRPEREPSEGEELAAWQALGSRGLRWRDEASDWDDLDDVSQLAGDEPSLGALDSSRTEHSDVYSFDEQFEQLEDQRSGAAPVLDPELDGPPPPVGSARVSSRRPAARRTAPSPTTSGTGPRGRPTRGGSSSGGRDLQTATVVGVGMILALSVAYALGSAILMLLSTVVITAAALELYNLIQHRGFRPATLLGVCGTVAVMVAGYGRWGEAVPLILALMFVMSMLWYMVGVVDARPVVNVGLTMMTFVWVGVFGSYASLLLSLPHGKQLFLLPILVTVAADTAAYFAGSSFGSRPLAPLVSPGKTWEGVVAGGLAAIVFSFVLSRLPFLSKTWTGGHALLLGLVIAVIAPIGDLCESMVKRDLDLKDSGSVLPGHGGLLDRFDSVLFVLPATYYLLLYLKLG